MPYKDPIKRRESARIRAIKYRAARLDEMRIYQREWKRKWRETHRASEQEYQKLYRRQKPEKIAVWNRTRWAKTKADPAKMARHVSANKAYRKKYPERCRATIRNWQARNIEHVRFVWRVAANRRRTLQMANGGYANHEQLVARCAYYGWCCAYCHKQLTKATVNMDHVIPIKTGGKNWPSNQVPACESCNSKKNVKRWIPCPIWQQGPRMKMSESG